MSLGERIEQRRKAIGISQAELARRVGIRQSTMNTLINGNSRTTRSIVELARELGTSAAYLMGKTDDPSEGAAPSPPPAPARIVMEVVLPAEALLAEMFDILLAGINPQLPEAERAEQAQLLAERLPIGLSRLQSHQIDQRRGARRDRPAKADRSPAARRLPEPQR